MVQEFHASRATTACLVAVGRGVGADTLPQWLPRIAVVLLLTTVVTPWDLHSIPMDFRG